MLLPRPEMSSATRPASDIEDLAPALDDLADRGGFLSHALEIAQSRAEEL